MIRPSLVPVTRRRPITLDDAARIYPGSYWNQQRWLRAIGYLRERSKCGWLIDNQVTRKGS